MTVPPSAGVEVASLEVEVACEEEVVASWRPMAWVESLHWPLHIEAKHRNRSVLVPGRARQSVLMQTDC